MLAQNDQFSLPMEETGTKAGSLTSDVVAIPFAAESTHFGISNRFRYQRDLLRCVERRVQYSGLDFLIDKDEYLSKMAAGLR